MTQLQIGKGFRLPVDAVTQTFGILAIRGAGKTYTAAVLAEELVKAGQQVVIVDPVGVWWGLRSSADGKRPGLPVVILGGDHSDVPLEVGAGEAIADLLVDEHLSAVIDLSHMRKGEQATFMTAFAERLYHRNRDPLHLILDEADAFAPQRPQKGRERLLGAIEDLVRRGRARGLGVTLVTQRAAVLNKDVLTQIEVLVTLRTVSPQDRAALDAWIRAHGSDDERDQVMATVASLPIGTAWIWSPGWLGILQRVEIRARETFDSSATPKSGGRARAPRAFADVDLAALKERISESIERAQADDPKVLRRRIAELERQLQQAKTAKPAVETIEVPVVAPELVDRLEAVLRCAGDVRDVVTEPMRAAYEAAELVALRIDAAVKPIADAMLAVANTRPAPPLRQAPAKVSPSPKIPRERAQPSAAPRADGPAIKLGARRMLAALIQHHPMRMTRAQLATLSKLKSTSGTYSSYLSALKTNGLVEEAGGELVPTQAGFDYLGADVPRSPTTTEELLELWRGNLKAGARRMLDVLVEAYPDELTRAELADAVGLEASSGTFSSYLSALRTNGLADVDAGTVRASDTLFIGNSR